MNPPDPKSWPRREVGEAAAGSLELLSDVVQGVEASGGERWPTRKDVVSCTGVFRQWLEAGAVVVRPPAKSGKITFPSSLKQVSSAAAQRFQQWHLHPHHPARPLKFTNTTCVQNKPSALPRWSVLVRVPKGQPGTKSLMAHRRRRRVSAWRLPRNRWSVLVRVPKGQAGTKSLMAH
ncbi:unnamed protein product [Urochloa humidicola]